MAEDKTTKVVNKLTELKKAYKEALGEAAAGSEAAALRAGQLKDQINDVNEAVKNFAGGSKFEQLGGIFGTLGNQLSNLDFGGAAESAQRFADVSKKMTFKEATAGLGDLTKGLGTLAKAILTNPLFIIAGVITGVVIAVVKLKDSIKPLGEVFEFFANIIGDVVKQLKEWSDQLGLSNFALEEHTEKVIESSKKQQEAVTARYDAEIAVASAAGKNTEEIEIRKQIAILQSLKVQLDAIKALAAANGEYTEEQIKQIEDIGKAVFDANTQIQVQQAKITKREEDELKKRNENLKKSKEDRQKIEEDDWKKLNAELKHKYELYIENERETQEELKRIREQEEKDRDTKEQAALDKVTRDEIEKLNARKNAFAQEAALIKLTDDDKKAKLKAQLDAELAVIGKSIEEKEQAYRNYNEAIKKIDEDSFKARVANVNKYTQAVGSALNSIVGVFSALEDLQNQKREQELDAYNESLDTRLTSLNDARDAELEKEGLTAQERENIKLKYDLAEYQLELERYNRETEIKKKSFEQNKKLQIATTIISTITGAVAAFTGMVQSIPGPVGLILGAVAAAAVAATGAIQVAKIKSTKFDAGSPPSPPKAGGLPSLESANKPQSGPTLFKVGERNEPKNEPIKAYVVSQEVESSTNKSNVIKRRATL